MSHAALPHLLRDGLSCAREKKLPSVLLTTNPNPGEEKILLFLARERCTAAPSDSQQVTGGIENTLKVQ